MPGLSRTFTGSLSTKIRCFVPFITSFKTTGFEYKLPQMAWIGFLNENERVFAIRFWIGGRSQNNRNKRIVLRMTYLYMFIIISFSLRTGSIVWFLEVKHSRFLRMSEVTSAYCFPWKKFNLLTLPYLGNALCIRSSADRFHWSRQKLCSVFQNIIS